MPDFTKVSQSEIDGSDPSRTVPFDFGQKPTNLVSNYRWARNVKRYMKFCADRCKTKARDLAVLCEYKNINKFQRRRAAWNLLDEPVPLVYFQAIGGDINILQAAIELDQKEYEEALAASTIPRYITVRLMAAVYCPKSLPPETTEEEAIRYAYEFLKDHQHTRCMINWPGLKTIYIDHGKEPWYEYRCPTLRMNDYGFWLGYDGSREGRAFIR